MFFCGISNSIFSIHVYIYNLLYMQTEMDQRFKYQKYSGQVVIGGYHMLHTCWYVDIYARTFQLDPKANKLSKLFLCSAPFAITSYFPLFSRQEQQNVIHVLNRKCTPKYTYQSLPPFDPKHTVTNQLEEQDKTAHPDSSVTLFSAKGVTSKFNLQYELSCLSRTWFCVLKMPPYCIHKM